MALFTGNLNSRVLGMETQLTAILPYDRVRELEGGEQPCKVLYLLHGLGENASSWHRYSALEHYVRNRNIAVIMPEVQRSFYADMAYGMDYFTYMTEELPALCAGLFRLSTKREDTCVAGLSMGGFGALKCALNRPDLYGAAASFSGAVDMQFVVDTMADNYIHQVRAVLGDENNIGETQDIRLLCRRVAKLPSAQQPRLLLTCGSDDPLTLDMNRAVWEDIKNLPLDVEYREWPGGHDWVFWDTSIELTIRTFFGENDAV